MNFQAGFQAVPFNSGGVLGWTSPFIKWGGFGSTSPFIEWGGFRALSLRCKTPPLNEGGAFQTAPPSTVAITATSGRLGSWLGVIEPCQRPSEGPGSVGCEQRDV